MITHDEAVQAVFEFFGCPDELDAKGLQVVKRGKCPEFLRRSRVQKFLQLSEQTMKVKIEAGYFREHLWADGTRVIPRADVVNFLTADLSR
jgi:hypothetical protein